jgi:sulfide:quinone oxidoreductase
MSPHRVLIAGGGIAALESALALRGLGGEAIEIVLVSPNEEFSFRAHEVREPFGGPAPLRLPLDEILDGVGEHVRDSVIGVDPEARVLALRSGGQLAYDSLLLCLGGTPFPANVHGITFDRPGDPAAFAELLEDIGDRLVENVAFVVPDAAGWTLPAYDLALMLRGWADRQRRDLGIRVLTGEQTPLEMFGPSASRDVAGVLARHRVEVLTGAQPVVISDAAIVAGAHWSLADRIVSLPRLAGPRLAGVPSNWEGFTEVGPEGRVPGLAGVFAVGDGAAHRRKQGGLAAQQADTAARALLADIGLSVPAAPDPPMLRGVLATPDGPLFLQAPLGYGAPGTGSTASLRPLWDPPSKVATRWLGPHLDGLVRRRTSAFAA